MLRWQEMRSEKRITWQKVFPPWVKYDHWIWMLSEPSDILWLFLSFKITKLKFRLCEVITPCKLIQVVGCYKTRYWTNWNPVMGIKLAKTTSSPKCIEEHPKQWKTSFNLKLRCKPVDCNKGNNHQIHQNLSSGVPAVRLAWPKTVIFVYGLSN